MSDTTILVEQDDDGTNRLEIVCKPFDPADADYDGELFLGIYWDGKEEAFGILKREHAAKLAELLTRDH
ncbi:hypothetical protein [Mycolicibacterium brumae]|uniref:Uncharacterized protein n=1 Tax=Mycolicibacterium brumae TaxID=85968 RepID=A0A2G5PBJ7_9MYCO|nr:hypothetical protein [Mycolicibacterium brumae]MCV7191489.1 hypothetical protein [Mycolicibacterium brumae]PIB75706.1 hypothetical protein CQY22_008170 [Mycolicibacterium brumae]RWA16202.1 hypothetical protein MBRU_08830 [Mycolicibacterium brumae DSM 44177]UWW09404.1 hypothetical protein L2Z93_002501 [Mycolicibacterium brumae]